MKELGHSYVAEKATSLIEPDIYIGSLIPDLVWYTSARPALEKADLHAQRGFPTQLAQVALRLASTGGTNQRFPGGKI